MRLKLNGIVADKPSSSYVSAMPDPTAFDLSPRRALAASSPTTASGSA
ncbi:MAG: hypothetical protein ACRYG8_04775 [Janthinobacterium lividum]